MQKKYYPKEKFIKNQEGYPERKSYAWRRIGKLRLKKVLPKDEYKYAIAEYPPTGDKVFESAQQ